MTHPDKARRSPITDIQSVEMTGVTWLLVLEQTLSRALDLCSQDVSLDVTPLHFSRSKPGPSGGQRQQFGPGLHHCHKDICAYMALGTAGNTDANHDSGPPVGAPRQFQRRDRQWPCGRSPSAPRAKPHAASHTAPWCTCWERPHFSGAEPRMICPKSQSQQAVRL